MELYANLTACLMRLHQLLHSAAPREITAIIELGFASCDYCINLHSAAPRAINSVIALYAVRLAYITVTVITVTVITVMVKCCIRVKYSGHVNMPSLL